MTVFCTQPVLAFSRRKAKSYMRNMCVKSSAQRLCLLFARIFGAEKLLFVQLQGVVDFIIKTAKGKYIPVEYKNMNSNCGKACIDHKYQLVA